jgi:hypothetical protein
MLLITTVLLILQVCRENSNGCGWKLRKAGVVSKGLTEIRGEGMPGSCADTGRSMGAGCVLGVLCAQGVPQPVPWGLCEIPALASLITCVPVSEL